MALFLPLCFSFCVLSRCFLENWAKPFYLYLSSSCSFSDDTPLVISLLLSSLIFIDNEASQFRVWNILWQNSFYVFQLLWRCNDWYLSNVELKEIVPFRYNSYLNDLLKLSGWLERFLSWNAYIGWREDAIQELEYMYFHVQGSRRG